MECCKSSKASARGAGTCACRPSTRIFFARTAPRWNCVDYADGMHYTPGDTCLWCGKTREQIAQADAAVAFAGIPVPDESPF